MPGLRVRRVPLALALAALLAFLPLLGNAQGLPPSLFFGSVDGLTVDGGPYDGVTPIELINADGDVVSTAQRGGGGLVRASAP